MSRRKTTLTLLKRMGILAILLGALVFSLSTPSVVSVRAEDCTTVNMDLEYCYFTCAGYPTESQRIQCYSNCQMTNALRGATCSYPTHSPMIVGGSGCDPAANGQRAYDNCMAGVLSGWFQDQYLIYMAYYNDQEISCGMIGQGVELQGCW